MLRNGLAAVLGPSSPSTSSHMQSICDALEIPHVNTGCQSRLRRTHYAINLHPHPSALGQVSEHVKMFQIYWLMINKYNFE